MDSLKFKDILYNTIIPSTLSDEETIKKVEPLSEYLKKNIPAKLYRFRGCNERNLEAFYKEQIWVSTPDTMNDGFDSRLFYNKQEVFKWIEEINNPDFLNTILETIEKMIKNNCLPPYLQNYTDLQKACFCFTQATEEQRKKIATEFQNFVKESINNSLPLVSTIAQQTIKFCCLSENINSTAMWGLYSNDETGFALAYDLRGNLLLPLENGKIKNCSIYPIIYGKERFKVPTNYIQFLLYSRLMSICLDKMGLSNHPIKNLLLSCNVCPDITVPTKIALHKSSEWKYEKEWRLFYPSCGEQNYFLTKHEFFIKAPVAIYLGRRISHIYEKILKDIAKEKNIPVYKMYLNDEKATYKLHYRKIK